MQVYCRIRSTQIMSQILEEKKPILELVPREDGTKFLVHGSDVNMMDNSCIPHKINFLPSAFSKTISKMNLSRVTITVLLTAAAESASGRTLHWGQHQGGQGGRREDFLAKLQGMVDTKCNSDFVCPESVTGCDEVIDKPERPLLTWWNMSDEEKAEAKAEMEAKKDAFKEQVLTCACCDGKTVEELVGNGRISDYDEDGLESSSLDEDGLESSVSSEDGSSEDSSEDSIGEDTDMTSLPGQATSLARASASVEGLDISNAAGHAGMSWALIFAAASFGIVSLAL